MFGVACDPLQHTSMYQRAEEDSEDSDGEGGLGNVSRVIIRPPGHSGKAKRGHLCFDAAFETGNLGRADLVGEFEYDLFLRPDTCNPRFRFWFNFTVDNVKQDQRVIFNIVNISKSRNLFKDGLTPLVKSSARPKWQRIPKTHVFYYRSPVHQQNYVLSFAYAFDKEEEVYQFAIAPPYSYSRLQSYLGVIETKFPNTFTRSVIGKSLQGRKLELLTIDHVEKPQKNDVMKNPIRVIVILVRAHPGESPASFVCQGFLEFILSSHPIACVLRENFVFKIIPMINPDGVFLGNNRCNLVGQDLNRTWNVATEFSSPTITATKNMLKEIDSSDCYQIDFVIDFHAHTSLNGSFIYGNTYEDVYRYERHLVFPKILSTNCDDFSQSNMLFNADERKSGSCRRFCCERLSDTVNSYTLEVSMCGYYLKGSNVMAQFTEEGYMRFGRNVVRSLFEYYRFTSVLIIPMANEISTRKGRPKTHHARSRRRISPEVKPRPKTTRTNAPISYNDLSIRYDSSTSNEGSPVRYGIYNGYGFGTRQTGNIYMNNDQFSLLAIQSSKFNNLDFSNEITIIPPSTMSTMTAGGGGTTLSTTQFLPKIKTAMTASSTNTNNLPTRQSEGAQVTIAPKPYLSIIDFNQITRGGLEQATKKCGHITVSSNSTAAAGAGGFAKLKSKSISTNM